MIDIKSSRELELMKEACVISAQALQLAGEAVRPGITTYEIDKIAYDFIIKCGAKPNFLNYGGFPATACISIKGDIVSIDLGAAKNGYNGDNAATFICGSCSPEVKRLVETTREALYKGIEQAVPGNRVGDIGNAVQTYCEERGFSVVRDFVGHGVGTKLHEEPSVPNFGHAGRGIRLLPGMTLAIEPMINLGTHKVKTLSDGWTVKTADGKASAHFENTVAITTNGPVILTKA